MRGWRCVLLIKRLKAAAVVQLDGQVCPVLPTNNTKYVGGAIADAPAQSPTFFLGGRASGLLAYQQAPAPQAAVQEVKWASYQASRTVVWPAFEIQVL